MGLKSKVFEFMITHDIIPAKIRWKKSASGVGRLYNDVFHMVGPEDRRKLGKLMYDWGVRDADKIVEDLKIGRDLHGCALVVMTMNCIFGIKSHIARENSSEVEIHATQCLWKDKDGWTPQVCASIERYDEGLIQGINSHVTYFCPRRRSKGDEVCQLILRLDH